MNSQQAVGVSLSPVEPKLIRRDSWPAQDFSSAQPIPLSTYWRVVLNRRWMVLAVALGVFLTVLFATIWQKPVYLATGSLEVDMPKGSVASVGELFQDRAAPVTYLETQAEILHSTAMVSKLMAQLGSDDQMESEPDKSSIAAVQGKLSVAVLKESGLIQVSYESESPEQASKVVNQLMALYISQGTQERTQTAHSASTWLLDQVTDTRAKLEQATQNLQRFEEDHRLLFFETKDGAFVDSETARLQQLQAELNRAQALRIERETRTQRAKAGDDSALQTPLLDDLLKKETELNQQLSKLSTRFGPNFPEVKQVQEQLDAVRADESTERTRAIKAADVDFVAASRQEALARRAYDDQQKIVRAPQKNSFRTAF